MKKFMLWSAMALAAVAFASCKSDKPSSTDLDEAVEDGFYVAGDATGVSDLKPAYMMTAGLNEADGQNKRDGMFEKYLVLEGGKDFDLKLYEAGAKTRYSATLAEFTPPEGSTIYGEDPQMAILKGALQTGDDAPAMKVTNTGLYHIVLDLNKANDLASAQIIVAPVEWGVRGGMNGWGFTKMEATGMSNDGISYVIKDAKMSAGAEFKFAYGDAWKITLDDAKKVRANTNLGAGTADGTLAPGGKNIKVDAAGLYDITLTYKLAAGEIGASYDYTVTMTEASAAPTKMYMIGAQWGNWSWESDEVVALNGVPNAEGIFWCTRYFEADKGFKFSSTLSWDTAFAGSGVGYTFDGDGNCVLSEAGFYTVFVDGTKSSVEVTKAEVYGMGDVVFAGGWDFDTAAQFTAEGDKMVITTTGEGELRLASKVVPSAAIEGVTTAKGWLDWWKTEFIFFEDGVIEYRGAGGDQARTSIASGKKITLDFNAGTATVE